MFPDPPWKHLGASQKEHSMRESPPFPRTVPLLLTFALVVSVVLLLAVGWSFALCFLAGVALGSLS